MLFRETLGLACKGHLNKGLSRISLNYLTKYVNGYNRCIFCQLKSKLTERVDVDDGMRSSSGQGCLVKDRGHIAAFVENFIWLQL